MKAEREFAQQRTISDTEDAAQTNLDALNERIASVEERIIDIITQIDDIKLQQNPQIEADYAVKLGYLETALLESEVAARRAKRKLALIQAQLNAGEAPSAINVAGIEAQLDEELAEWMQQAQEALDRYYELVALRTAMSPMAPVDAAELKRLYRELCMVLHPDICDPDEQNAALFLIVQSAYAAGDLHTLRSLAEVLGCEAKERSFETEDEAYAQIALLEMQLTLHEQELEHLMQEFPYSMKDKLADPRWVTTRARELKAQKRAFDEARAGYEARIEQLMQGGGQNE